MLFIGQAISQGAAVIPHSGDQATDDYGGEDLEFLKVLEHDYPRLSFRRGRKFAFRPPRTIIIGPFEPAWRLLLMHELGHALSGHREFGTDIKRLKMEAEAWDKARGLATHYGVEFDEAIVQDELDTYRNWLHQKSRCPRCGLTRFQTPDRQYHCPHCDSFAY